MSPVSIAKDAPLADGHERIGSGVEAGVARLRRLIEVARPARRPLIHLQHNPDPDALASAEALRTLMLRILGVDSILAYTGRVSRAENRAMLRHLDIRIRPAAHVDYAQRDLLIVVDTHPGSGTCRLPVGCRTPDVVVDHHPVRVGGPPAARFQYQDASFGSTSTMVGALFVANGIPFDARLATALTYGIRTDTMDLARAASPEDERIFREVYTRADKQILGRIAGARVPLEHFVVLSRALSQAEIADFALTTWLGEIDNGDVVAEFADLLLRLESIRWVMVGGEAGGVVYASLRAFRSGEPRAGDVAHEISGGHGGGHDTFAALQKPLAATDRAEAVWMDMRRRFLTAVKADAGMSRRLAAAVPLAVGEVAGGSTTTSGRGAVSTRRGGGAKRKGPPDADPVEPV